MEPCPQATKLQAEIEESRNVLNKLNNEVKLGDGKMTTSAS